MFANDVQIKILMFPYNNRLHLSSDNENRQKYGKIHVFDGNTCYDQCVICIGIIFIF